MTWTKFTDMHSGGGRKLAFEEIWIEAPEEEAVLLFEEIFGRDPKNVTCHCCGEDYSYYEREQEFLPGDAVVTAEDIARFRSGVAIGVQP